MQANKQMRYPPVLDTTPVQMRHKSNVMPLPLSKSARHITSCILAFKMHLFTKVWIIHSKPHLKALFRMSWKARLGQSGCIWGCPYASMYISVCTHLDSWLELIRMWTNRCISERGKCWFPFVLDLMYTWAFGRERRVFTNIQIVNWMMKVQELNQDSFTPFISVWTRTKHCFKINVKTILLNSQN